jgi:cytochrome c oxidase assembly factor 6
MAWGIPSWLGGGSSANPSLPESANQAPRSKDGGYIAPDRTSREQCYESRDIFFQCLEKNDILDAIKEDEKCRKVCPQEVMAYEKDCAKSWVRHFGEVGRRPRRLLTWIPDQILQGKESNGLQAGSDVRTDCKGGCHCSSQIKGRKKWQVVVRVNTRFGHRRRKRNIARMNLLVFGRPWGCILLHAPVG